MGGSVLEWSLAWLTQFIWYWFRVTCLISFLT